jgi:hypothetical protein
MPEHMHELYHAKDVHSGDKVSYEIPAPLELVTILRNIRHLSEHIR